MEGWRFANPPFATELFQRNTVHRFAFLGVDQIGVNLGCSYILVRQHLRDRIDVRPGCNLQCGVGVAEAMESDRLRKEKRTGEDKT